ncbi:hypothetical protein [Glutamicibacter sp. TV12E]|uniref:hypothetical protein n=1 Tax=Glutamicibacter sp. TV12E TaxID=3446362 RepID=UPI004034AF7B
MAKKLIYWGQEIPLDESVNIDSLRMSIRGVNLHDQTRWIEIRTTRGKVSILVSAGIPVMFEETEPYEVEGWTLPQSG